MARVALGALVPSWSGLQVQEEEELEVPVASFLEVRVALEGAEAVVLEVQEGREGREDQAGPAAERPKAAEARELPSFSLPHQVRRLEAEEAEAVPNQRVGEEAGLQRQRAEAEAGRLGAIRQDLDLWEAVLEAREVHPNQEAAEAVVGRRPAWAEAQEPLQTWAAQREAARETPQAAQAEASQDLPPSAEAGAAHRQTTESPAPEEEAEEGLRQKAAARAEDSEVRPFHPSHP